MGLATRQNGVENRDKVYSEKTFYSLEENSFCHVTMDFNKPWFFKYSRKKKRRN